MAEFTKLEELLLRDAAQEVQEELVRLKADNSALLIAVHLAGYKAAATITTMVSQGAYDVNYTVRKKNSSDDSIYKRWLEARGKAPTNIDKIGRAMLIALQNTAGDSKQDNEALIKLLLDNDARVQYEIGDNLQLSDDLFKLMLEKFGRVYGKEVNNLLNYFLLQASDEKIKIVIDSQYFDANSKNSLQTMTKAQCIIRYASDDVVLHLLNKEGIDLNIADTKHDTPLILAAMRKTENLTILKSIADRTANLNKENIYGVSALHEAAQNLHVEAVSLLTTHPGFRLMPQQLTNVLVKVIREKDESNEQLDLCRVLIRAGANVNARGRLKYRDLVPPLEAAVERQQTTVTLLLLRAGANPRGLTQTPGFTNPCMQIIHDWMTSPRQLQDLAKRVIRGAVLCECRNHPLATCLGETKLPSRLISYVQAV